MSSARRKGWCPSLFEPMAAGDGLLVRVKPRSTGLTASQLRAVADAAHAYGSGRIEITNRANLQIRGLTGVSALHFGVAMRAAGLASPTQAAERRRNIQLPVLCGEVALEIAAQLEDWLETDATLAPLPAKFGFAIGGTGLDAAPPAADIQIFIGQSTCILAAGTAGVAIPASQIIGASSRLTRAFLTLSNPLDPTPSRMKNLIASLGPAAIFNQAGFSGWKPLPPAAPPRDPAALPPDFYALALPFGAADARLMREAATLAENFGTGAVRLGPTRSLVLRGVRDHTGLAQAAAQAGFLTDPDDPRLKVAACIGRPACPSAAADTRIAAVDLAAYWNGPAILHVSGCAKGCAHSGPAALTLTGTSQGGWNVILHGTAGGPPIHTGLNFGQILTLLSERSPTSP